MAFQVSPGVNISEVDATTIVPAVATGNAGIACAFQWGPAEEIITISSEDDLVKIFGKPDNDIATNWLSASNYLTYSGGLQVVRTIDKTNNTHLNATDATGTNAAITILDQGGGFEATDTQATGTRALVGDTYSGGISGASAVFDNTSSSGYAVGTSNATSINLTTASTDPDFTSATGTIVVTAASATSVTAISIPAGTNGAGYQVGDEINIVTAGGSGCKWTLTAADIVEKGIGLKVDYTASNGAITDVTGAVFAPSPNNYSDGVHYVAIDDGDKNAVIEITVSSNAAADADIVVIHPGSGYANTGGNDVSIVELGAMSTNHKRVQQITAFDQVDAGVGGILQSVAFTVAGSDMYLEAGDLIVWAHDGVDANTAVIRFDGVGSGTLVTNRSDFDDKDSLNTLTTQSFIAKYAGTKGNGIAVGIVHQDSAFGTVTFTGTASGQTEPWTLKASDVFDAKPGTSTYVLGKNGSTNINDEIHVAVIDADGSVTGTAGTALERYASVSLCTDAKNDSGGSNYYKDVINANSQYVYATGNWDGAISNSTDASNWEGKLSTSTASFTAQASAITSELAGGAGNNVTANTAGNRWSNTGDVGYGLFNDPDTSEVSLLISGEADNVLAGNIIDTAINRKDAIAFYSPERLDVINSSRSSSQKADDIIAFKNLVNRASSYAVMDSGWKRVYDRYNDIYRDIPLNSDIAGLVARTEQTRDAWWSPAGYERGALKNVVKLHYNPTQVNRDTLYKAAVNPVVSFPGQGIILFGDKTCLGKPSAFDRINVRRLFIVLEKAISRAAQFSLFEFNDGFTRSQFKSMVEPFLRTIKARRGIFDYKVVCDNTNNTSDVIDRNEFVGDIYIKPARSINFIQLNFVAVRTGVSFNEVAGAV